MYTPSNRCELLLGGAGATRDSLDQVRDLGFHVIVTANSKGQLWMQHGAGLAATLGSEVVAVDRMDTDQVSLRVRLLADFGRLDGGCSFVVVCGRMTVNEWDSAAPEELEWNRGAWERKT